MILVFNKIDAYRFVHKDEDDLSPSTKENLTFAELKKSWMAQNNATSMFISAKNKENIDEFKDLLYRQVKEIHAVRYPFNNFLY